MIKKVFKTDNLRGVISIPADKSISHRAIMLSAISQGKNFVKNISRGADCLSTVKVFKQLGVEINDIDEHTLSISGNGLKKSEYSLNCGNSGTTTRLLAGILSRQNFTSILIGDESLSRRPMKRIITPLELMGAQIDSKNNCIPLTIKGGELCGIDYKSGLSSAQVKSCVLLAGLGAIGQTKYTEPFVSRNHTELMLKYLGADININNNITTIMPSELSSKDIEVVGDISSAAFFIVAGLICKGSDFIIKNVGINPTRTGIIDIARRMNGNIEVLDTRDVSGELCADIRVKYSENLKACNISGEDIPRLIDELPVIAVLASQAEGETIIKDAGDLRNKETDRITFLVKELKKIGVDIEDFDDGFSVRGKLKLQGNAELNVYNDHRLAMSFYVAGLVCENEIAIRDFEWINISFPEFENLMQNLQ